MIKAIFKSESLCDYPEKPEEPKEVFDTRCYRANFSPLDLIIIAQVQVDSIRQWEGCIVGAAD